MSSVRRSGARGTACASPTIQPNDIEAVPGYELLGILGRGGMGIVFHRPAVVPQTAGQALKMILSGRHARPTERARFQREAEAVARLQHPNIVQIYEVGEQNGLPYFSLEFVDAGSLGASSGEQSAAAAPVGTALVQELAGDAYAHKRGIVHRDLKPANILLHLDESQILKDGQLTDSTAFRNLLAYVPKITDFGLAKHMGGEEGPVRLGAIVGTPSYMAPEQARGTSGAIGPAADVYARARSFTRCSAAGRRSAPRPSMRPPSRCCTRNRRRRRSCSRDPARSGNDLPGLPAKEPGPPLRQRGGDRRGFAAIPGQRANPGPAHASAQRVVKWATRRPLLAAVSLGALTLTLILWWVWWQRAVAFQQEKEQIYHAWQKSEAELQQAMQTIDQMVAAAPADHAEPVLLKAKQFYERLLESDGPPARVALTHYRLGKIQERLGDQAAVQRVLPRSHRPLGKIVPRLARRRRLPAPTPRWP